MDSTARMVCKKKKPENRTKKQHNKHKVAFDLFLLINLGNDIERVCEAR